MDHTLNTTPPTLGLEEGQAAFKNGDWAQSLALAGQFLEHHNDSIAGWMLKARSLVQLGQWDAAHEAFAQVLQGAPADYNAWLETGHLHFAQGQFAQASTAYERALALSNKRFEAHLALARVALVNGQQAMAERLYAQAIQAAQGSPESSNGTQAMRHWWRVHRACTSSIFRGPCCCFLLLPFFVRLLSRPFQPARSSHQAIAPS